MFFLFEGEIINSTHVIKIWIKQESSISYILKIKMTDQKTLIKEFTNEDEAEEYFKRLFNCLRP